ncbi:hypothetical protein I3842_01G026000 [Carya illinoinensis]|uniref:Uncharacterized protein n=1 Tax=Carya illinoinensis TaxID=32201 RepID=A0A922K322_CARIL|nr:hypothetical protein I3842_01G026000 [Carya illinoinensis]
MLLALAVFQFLTITLFTSFRVMPLQMTYFTKNRQIFIAYLLVLTRGQPVITNPETGNRRLSSIHLHTYPGTISACGTSRAVVPSQISTNRHQQITKEAFMVQVWRQPWKEHPNRDHGRFVLLCKISVPVEDTIRGPLNITDFTGKSFEIIGFRGESHEYISWSSHARDYRLLFQTPTTFDEGPYRI